MFVVPIVSSFAIVSLAMRTNLILFFLVICVLCQWYYVVYSSISLPFGGLCYIGEAFSQHICKVLHIWVRH